MNLSIPQAPWIFIGLFIFLILVTVFTAVIPLVFRRRKDEGEKIQQYLKRETIFDVKSEKELFHILLDLYSDRYYIFPEMNYSHVIQPNKQQEWNEQRRLRSRVDRKSADFVLCDKEEIGPQLIIELDGSSHLNQKRKHRDEFVNELMKYTNLPICHLSPENMTKEYVKKEIDFALQQSKL